MRRKPDWEDELDELSEQLSDLINDVEPEESEALLAYLDAAVPKLREVRVPGPLRRVLHAASLAANLLVIALCVSLTAAAIIFSTNDNPNKAFLGLRFYNVESESMTPTIYPDGTRSLKGGFYKGDAIVVKTASAEDVKQWDVITFWKDPEHIETPWTHRVMEIIPSENGGGSAVSFITKGDHNTAYDPPLDGNYLIGIKLFTLPMLGTILTFAKRHLVLSVIFSILFTGGLFWLFLWLTNSRRRRRRKIRRELKKTLRS